jgi:hypothetical protein
MENKTRTPYSGRNLNPETVENVLRGWAIQGSNRGRGKRFFCPPKLDSLDGLITQAMAATMETWQPKEMRSEISFLRAKHVSPSKLNEIVMAS